MRPLSIGVVGAGFAGSAAALFLQRTGHRVTLYEAVRDPGPVGAGIMLQPTGMAVLAALDLLGPVLDRGARIERMRCATSTGRQVFSLAYDELGPGVAGLGLHRGVLFETLFDAVRRSFVDLRCGTPVEHLESISDGRRVVSPSGETLGEHDIVVAADGARSQLHDDTPLTKRSTPYPWGALWFVGSDPDETFGSELFQVVHSTRRMIGFLPTGLGPASAGDDRPLVSVFWSLPCAGLEAWRANGLQEWKDDIARTDPRAADIVGQIGGHDDVLFARYYDTVMPRWDADRVVYIGDSGHAASPQLGQGCNLALADALTLSACIAAGDDPRSALSLYSRIRRKPLNYYQWASRWLTPFFQSGYDALGPLRDFGLPIASRIPWVRRQMLLTMAGVKRGLLSRSFRFDGPLALLAAPDPVAVLTDSPDSRT